jgi:hypothetical protein
MEKNELLKLPEGEKLTKKTEEVFQELSDWLSKEPEGMSIKETTGNTFPVISIKQGLTQNIMCPPNARNGQMYTSFGDTLPNSIIIVPCFLAQTKMLINKEKKLECYSYDLNNGTKYGQCDPCLFPASSDSKYKCKNKLTILALVEPGNRIYKIDFRGASFFPGLAIKQLTEGKRIKIWEQKYKLSTKEETGENGKYYTYVVEAGIEPVSDVMLKLGEGIGRKHMELWKNTKKQWQDNLINQKIDKATETPGTIDVVIDENSIDM